MNAPLHLVRLAVDASKLYAFARKSRAAARDYDVGYALHAALTALFDHGAPENARVAPRPFHIVNPAAPRLDVLGYSGLDHVALADRARTFGDPFAWGVCDLDGMASKPMPSVFEAGKRLGFAVRVCPIRRVKKRGPMQRDQAEVDAFLAKSWAVCQEVKLDRGEVYRAWLDEQVAKEDAARVLDASMTRFQLDRFHRRTQGAERKGHRSERPDVAFEGELEVVNPESFARRLARGVGRHRSFGFGMLLLRPARTR